MNRKIRILTRLLLVAMITTSTTMISDVARAGDSWAAPPNTPERLVQQSDYHLVVSGDTLYDLSKKYQVTVRNLKDYNGLPGSLILPGQKLYLSACWQDQCLAMVISRNNISTSREDIMLLAHLIHAEARGENFTGQVAVGAVVLNRMDSPEFPGTLRGVIMQSNERLYQFSPVGDGSINLTPDQSSIQAALRALAGEDPSSGALFFYNPAISSDRWIRTLPVIKRIGNHVFASVKA